jgi:hypothetical protein
MDSEARRPPISGVPTVRETDPFSLSARVTLVLPPALNQNPAAMPRP